jgi:hypothetical protein
VNGSVTTPNVYYLPVRGELPDGTPPARRRGRAARLRRAWWRLRFSGAEIWLIVRRTARHLWSDGDGGVALRVDETARAHAVGPARIIDFVAARGRLRPRSD